MTSIFHFPFTCILYMSLHSGIKKKKLRSVVFLAELKEHKNDNEAQTEIHKGGELGRTNVFVALILQQKKNTLTAITKLELILNLLSLASQSRNILGR